MQRLQCLSFSLVFPHTEQPTFSDSARVPTPRLAIATVNASILLSNDGPLTAGFVSCICSVQKVLGADEATTCSNRENCGDSFQRRLNLR